MCALYGCPHDYGCAHEESEDAPMTNGAALAGMLRDIDREEARRKRRGVPVEASFTIVDGVVAEGYPGAGPR